MTTLIGIVYDKGTLILADTQRTAGQRIIRPVEKIRPLGNNLLWGCAGSVGAHQILFNEFREDVRSYRIFLEKDVIDNYKARIKRQKNNKEKLKKFRQLSLGEKCRKVFGEEFMLIEDEDGMEVCRNPLRDVEGNIEYQTSSLVYHAIGKELVLEVETAVEFLRQRKLEKEENDDLGDFSIILAGYDKNGPSIYGVTLSGSIDKGNGYLSIGSGSNSARPRIGEFYEEGLSLEEAMQLAIYSGLRADQENIYTNECFRIKVIEKDKGKVMIRTIEQNLVDLVTKEMLKIRVRFPFRKF